MTKEQRALMPVVAALVFVPDDGRAMQPGATP